MATNELANGGAGGVNSNESTYVAYYSQEEQVGFIDVSFVVGLFIGAHQ